jgi:hypothetical protein
MHQIVKTTIYIFLTITTITALVVIAALIDMWFFAPPEKHYPYFSGLLTSLVVEIATVVIGLAKTGIRYMPKVVVNKDEDSTLKFMENFISPGRHVTIVSNRASWLNNSEQLMSKIRTLLRTGVRIEVFTRVEVNPTVKQWARPQSC